MSKCYLVLLRWAHLVLLGALAILSQTEAQGSVAVSLCQRVSGPINAWPETVLYEYEQASFVFDRIPQAYTDAGVRDEWPNPLLVRATAELVLPIGEVDILLRSRRAARLWIDGELIASHPFPKLIRDGLDPVERPYIPLGPRTRFPAKGDQESLTEFEAPDRLVRMTLEFYVGGFANKRPMRPETGETLIAISRRGTNEFYLAGTGGRVALVDSEWDAYRMQRHVRLDQLDQERRRVLAASRAPYWARRHEWAREVWGKPTWDSSASTIDQLVEREIDDANAIFQEEGGANEFYSKIYPLLEERCLTCHGAKAKGGLRLDSFASATAGGDSGLAAVVPGQPDKSLLVELIETDDEGDRMPPEGEPLEPAERDALRQWVAAGAKWPSVELEQVVEPLPLVADWQFLRRVWLDVAGVFPGIEDVRTFLADARPDKRSRMIDRLLGESRWADHWVSYWQDVLAENPTIVNPTLNNTGPFRWWIYESFADNKPMDRFVTELVMMEGSLYGGGPAGFGMASQNDVPLAAKANILTTAFMAKEMKCSRCHDAPFHDNTQEQLFSLAAMLARDSVSVPESSSVPLDKRHDKSDDALIRVTLPVGSKVPPRWPFKETESVGAVSSWLVNQEDSRERLALFLTSPENKRFPAVIVNRLWQRLMGRGLIEPVGDWENADSWHADLLMFLARELVVSGYDLKHVTRMILNSQTYQRKRTSESGAIRYFAGYPVRGLSAEQIVDALFGAAGKELRTEPITIDVGGGRPWQNAIHLGDGRRAWMFGGVANNRDRPSLVLPRVQAVVDLLGAFGWRASRQEPLSVRESVLSPLQPAMLNNGVASTWLTRLSDDHDLTEVALRSEDVGELATELYLRFLSRPPTVAERKASEAMIGPGFAERRVRQETRGADVDGERSKQPPLFVTWANHLMPEATTIQLAEAEAARRGDPPTTRLTTEWRERFEDLIWSLINLPETIHYP